MNAQGDRLSSLPDDIIHKILPFINIKDAIRTCVLSSRWRFIWTTMPYLNFSNEDFICHFVILCDDEADKCIGIFAKCANLINLTLKWFKTNGSVGFSIVHPRLSNLTLENDDYTVNFVNVVAPQLQNLTIRSCHAKHVITAPGLASLLYAGDRPLHLSADGFPSLKKADICVTSPRRADAHQIVCLLQKIPNVHILTFNLEIVELLSSSVDLMLQQPSPFVNLKSLKIYPKTLDLGMHTPKKVTMSTELKSYFLDRSPGSTLTMVLREEVKAQKIMAELGVILEKEKDNTKTKRTHLERGKAHMDKRHKPKKQKIGGDMAPMKSRWKNLGVQIEKARLIISKLQSIEELVTKLPASNMAKIQPCFSSLCAEADIAISQITDCMKIEWDENRLRS